MVRLKNIEIDGNEIKCDIYPEDSKLAGHVVINEEKGTVSRYDLPKGYEWCINHVNHAKQKLLAMDKSKDAPKELLAMWY